MTARQAELPERTDHDPKSQRPPAATDESAFVDPTAIICGKVIIKENVFVGLTPLSVRDEVNADGDMEPIVIGANSNIQDGVVIHSKSGAAVTVGEHTSIAHRSIVHGPCQVGNRCSSASTVLFNCVVEDGCVVRHNSVLDGCHLPSGFYVPSTERIGLNNRSEPDSACHRQGIGFLRRRGAPMSIWSGCQPVSPTNFERPTLAINNAARGRHLRFNRHALQTNTRAVCSLACKPVPARLAGRRLFRVLLRQHLLQRLHNQLRVIRFELNVIG